MTEAAVLPVSPADALKQEEEKLGRLLASPPRTILAVSDLHLGCGRDPATGRFARNENFFCDQAFRRFLDYQKGRADGPTLLVLNGDTFDFIRVFKCPATPEELEQWSKFLAQLEVQKSPEVLRHSISPKETTFGLGTNDYKSAWKLLQIASGHREFFQALAGWLEKGNRLLFTKGNHDLDLYWPLVRRALRLFIADAGATPQLVEERVFYCDNSLDIGNVYLEHGHRYDPEQQIAGGPVLPGNPKQLNLPLATFVARYLLNPLEQIEPFLDDIRPSQKILWLLLRRHPLQSLRVLRHSLTFIWRAAKVSRLRNSFWYGVYFATLAISILTSTGTLLAIVATVLYKPFRDWLNTTLGQYQFLLSALGILTPYIVATLKDLWEGSRSKKARPAGEDGLAAGVYRTLSSRPNPPQGSVIYAVMGHTHDQDIQRLPPLHGAQLFYLNTGTWIPLWPEDRPDLIGQILYPFVLLTRANGGEYRHEYLEWRDDRGAPAESVILEPR